MSNKVPVIIESGDYKVLAAGSVFSFEKEPLSILLDPNDANDAKITVIFKFICNENGQSEITFLGEDNTLTVTVNYGSNTDFLGPTVPAAIADNEKSTLYLMFKLALLDNNTRHLEYTFFVKAHPKNDPKKITKDGQKKQSK